MILELKIKLRSPMLGGLKPDHSGVRRFRREMGMILNNPVEWDERLRVAGTNAGVPGMELFVKPCPSFRSPSIFLYERRYRDSEGRPRVDMFEAFRKGTVITMDLWLRDDLPGCPTINQLQETLEFVGLYQGLSPFGSKFGFGQFSVENLGPKSAVSLPNEDQVRRSAVA